MRRLLAGGSIIATSSIYKMLSIYSLRQSLSSLIHGCKNTSSIDGLIFGSTVSICLIKCLAASGTYLNLSLLKSKRPFLINAWAVTFPLFTNGKFPLNIAYSTTPKLHTSVLEVYVPLPAVQSISKKDLKILNCWSYCS